MVSRTYAADLAWFHSHTSVNSHFQICCVWVNEEVVPHSGMSFSNLLCVLKGQILKTLLSRRNFVLEVWSERRSRAWCRGRMLPIWHGSIRIRPLHCNAIKSPKHCSSDIVRTWCRRGRSWLTLGSEEPRPSHTRRDTSQQSMRSGP